MIEDLAVKKTTPKTEVDKKKAERKAWLCVKRLLHDTHPRMADPDWQYKILRKGKPISLTGSLGGQYMVYPNGRVVDLGIENNNPELGRVYGTGMPMPDALATIIAWILHDEATIKKRWGCGSIRVASDQEIRNEDADFDRRYVYAESGSSFSSIASMLIPMIVMIPMLVVILPMIMQAAGALNKATNSTTTANNSTLLATSLPAEFVNFVSSPIFLIFMLLPIFAVFIWRFMEN